ncbi:hypothetical protein BZA77DRAFT_99770 [Pyronema omphalodes]|nr:hypothetical protein BZA77DRAFT_99770 [Pyronema omphalodes]
MSKRVAIIGAGPSGLSTAKAMLSVGIVPTVFDARNDVGGLWAPPELYLETTQLQPDMRTNISLSGQAFPGYHPYRPGQYPTFTSAKLMGEYLKGYSKEYLSNDMLRLGHKVTGVSQMNVDGVDYWRVKTADTDEIFDFLVIASGASSNPYIPLLDEVQTKFKGRFIHSSRYTGEEIIPRNCRKPQRILVIGGHMSGCEIAADLALRKATLPKSVRDKVVITHVFPRPFRILPRMLPFTNRKDPSAPRVLPLDLVLFDAGRFLDFPAPDSAEMLYEQRAASVNKLLGWDQGELGPQFYLTSWWRRDEIPIVVSESYDKFVRDRTILPVLGRFSRVSDKGDIIICSSIFSGREISTIEGLDTIIFATGYTPWPTLQSFLAPEILMKMGVQPGEDPHPRQLYDNLYRRVLCPQISRNIGFIGFQKLQHWGSIEMQGRWLASLFAGKVDWPSDEDIMDFGLRPDARREQHTEAPQNEKLGSGCMKSTQEKKSIVVATQDDYLETVSNLSKILNFNPLEIAGQAPHRPKPFIPACIGYASTDPADKYRKRHDRRAIQSLADILDKASMSPENVSRAIFAQLHGSWKFSVRVQQPSKCGTNAQFVYLGEAVTEFRPRLRTFVMCQDNQNHWLTKPAPARCLSVSHDVPEYAEVISVNGGEEINYLYRYDNLKGIITVFKVGDDGSYIFSHCLDFENRPLNPALEVIRFREESGWKATAIKMCPSTASIGALTYRFEFSGTRMIRFWIREREIDGDSETTSEIMYERLDPIYYKHVNSPQLLPEPEVPSFG